MPIPFYDDRYIKANKNIWYIKVYINFRGLNVQEDDIECEYFTIISIDLLLIWENKYFLQVYLDKCAYKIIEKQITDYVGDNPFEIDEN